MQLPKLPKIQDKTQRMAGKLIAGFFALMLALTVVSRAAEGMTTAVVQASAPTNGVITERVTLTGAVKPMEDMELTLSGSLYITSAKVEAGERVEAGDVLLEFDAEDVLEQTESQRNSLIIAKNKLAVAKNGAVTDTTTALANAELSLANAEADHVRLLEKLGITGDRSAEDYAAAEQALEDAKSDYDEAVKKARSDMADAAKTKQESAQKTVDSAQKAVDNARESRDEAVATAQYNYDSALARGTSTDLELNRLREAIKTAETKGDKSVAEAESTLSEAKKALNEARADWWSATLAIDVSDQQGVISAQNAVDSAQRALDSAKRSFDDSQRSVDDQLLSSARSVATAQRSLEQAQRDAADKERSSANSALQTMNEVITLEADVAAQEKTLAALEEILAADCKLLSPIDGTVQSIAAVGKSQDKATAARLSRNDAGFYFSAQTTSANANALAADDSGTLTYRSDGRDQRVEAVVTDIGAADDSGSVLVKASLPEGSYPAGAAGEMTVTHTSDRQATCVPVSALRSDSDSDYVLILEEKKTVTGLTYTARRVDVEVSSRDSALASLQGGLDREALVITGASKTVAAGDKVRLEVD